MPLRLLSAGAVILTFFCAFATLQAPGWPKAFAPPPAAPACTGQPLFTIGKFHTALPNFAHALSAVTLRDGRIRAVWYEGSAELRPDVRIMTATFDGRRWSAPRPIIGASVTAAATGRYVRKLGNATIYREAGGDLVLIYASLGLGGWSGTSLNLMRSRDDGETWSPPRHLTTSPIFNLGTNVRGPAVLTTDGFTLIPTSHEFLRSYPAVILLDGDDRVAGIRRIGVKFLGTQPFILVLTERRAIAFMRTDIDQATPSSRTEDTGWSWSEPRKTSVRNYDKPVTFGRLGGKRFFMIHSSVIPRDVHGARALMFELSEDNGRTWRPFHRLNFQLDRLMRAHYPWLMAGADGNFHLLFTLSRDGQGSELIHARFNHDWIAAQAGLSCP